MLSIYTKEGKSIIRSAVAISLGIALNLLNPQVLSYRDERPPKQECLVYHEKETIVTKNTLEFSKGKFSVNYPIEVFQDSSVHILQINGELTDNILVLGLRDPQDPTDSSKFYYYKVDDLSDPQTKVFDIILQNKTLNLELILSMSDPNRAKVEVKFVENIDRSFGLDCIPDDPNLYS